MADNPPAASVAAPIYMSAEEFRSTLKLLGLTIERHSVLLLTSKAVLYRYQAGTAPVTAHLAALLRIMLYQRQEPMAVMALAFPLSRSPR